MCVVECVWFGRSGVCVWGALVLSVHCAWMSACATAARPLTICCCCCCPPLPLHTPLPPQRHCDPCRLRRPAQVRHELGQRSTGNTGEWLGVMVRCGCVVFKTGWRISWHNARKALVECGCTTKFGCWYTHTHLERTLALSAGPAAQVDTTTIIRGASRLPDSNEIRPGT